VGTTKHPKTTTNTGTKRMTILLSDGNLDNLPETYDDAALEMCDALDDGSFSIDE
jgi:hypothetical protein